MPSPKHLAEDRLRALHDAAVSTGLTDHRDDLLLGIDPGVRSNLPFANSPSAQLLSDLFHLADATLRDGSVPLVPWLRNAAGLLGKHELASVFEDALQHLGQPVSVVRAGRRDDSDELPGRAFDDGGGARLIDRVEQVCKLKEPEAIVRRYDAPYPFSGLLELVILERPVVRCELLATLERPLSEEALSCFEREILAQERFGGVDEMKLVYLPPAAPEELVRRAFRKRIKLIPFDTYQGLINFSRYRAWLSNRLDTDLDYPPWLYVEQPADISVGGQPPVRTERALDGLCDLLATPEPRFALVLGKFGAGKTFLLREVARRLLAEGSLTPVLVEMRFLEKESSLRSLLSQHFGHADAGHVDPDRFLYMLREGKIALLFDGFDELAVRVTYDRVLHYFNTVLEAVGGNAKVVVSSRTEHFLDDRQIKKELARRAEAVQGYRLIGLRDFGEAQVRQFLKNRLKDEAEAEARHALICEIHDLLGLSENPRMLSFIADLDRDHLEAARHAEGEITPAKLYELLLSRWIARESKQADVSPGSLWSAVRALARTLWATPGQSVELRALPPELIPRMADQVQHLSPEEARLVLGSRSLLKRDSEGKFSFVHRSVLEWLVADEAARELSAGGKAGLLVAEAMSPLMARFFAQLADFDRASAWAREVFDGGGGGHAERNALKVASQLGVVIAADLEGHDIGGESLDGVKLFGANLRHANLEGCWLPGRDLTGAVAVKTRLARAHLRGSVLRDADLTGADLSFANLTWADLAGAKLTGARTLGAKLLGQRGLSHEQRESIIAEGGAALTTGVTWGLLPRRTSSLAIAFHPSGHLLAAGYLDGTIGLWEPTSGALLRTLQGHTHAVRTVAFSPDGRTLASGSDDRTIGLWDTASGALLRMLEGHTNSVLCVAFSLDGRALASGSHDNIVGLWRPASGAWTNSLQRHTGPVRCVAFSPDGRTLASGSNDTTIRLWDATSGARIRSLRGHVGYIRSVAFSPDGRALASGSDDATIRLWDIATEARPRTLQGHRSVVRSVAFSPDGRTLASGADNTSVELWDPGSGARLRSLQGPPGRLLSMALSPDGRVLASGTAEEIRLLDVVSGTKLRSLQGHQTSILSVAFSPDGRALASGSSDGMRLWAPTSGMQTSSLKGHPSRMLTVAWSPDGRALASGSSDDTIGLWDPTSGDLLRRLHGHQSYVLSVAWSPDGRTVASGSKDKTVGLWNAATGALFHLIHGHTATVWSVAWSPDGRVLASGSDDANVGLWDPASGTRLSTLQGHGASVLSVAWSPDGRALASGSHDNTVGLWHTTSGTRRHTLWGHTGAVWSVAFSPDGTVLASGSKDSTVMLWDPTSGNLLHTLRGHTAAVRSVAFSPDSRTLASGSDDNTIHLWDVATGRCHVVLLGTPEGWVAFIPEGPRAGAFKLGGNIAGAFWHIIGLARFEPGELDEFLPDDQKLRLPDDYRFLPR